MDHLANQLGKRIRALRDQLKWNQSRLAAEAGLAASTLSEIESGRYLPNLRVIVDLARALGVPVDSLLRTQDSPLESLLCSLEGEMDVAALHWLSERCLRYAQVERLAGAPTLLAPVYQPAEGGVAWAQTVAELERERLHLGLEPIADITAVVESSGLRVIGVELGKNGCDAILLRSEDLGAFAVINRSKTGMAQQFALARAYGHFLLHPTLSVYVERAVSFRENLIDTEASSFAAAFLMPAQGIEELLRRRGLSLTRAEPSMRNALVIKSCYQVSALALAWRLYGLGWIDSDEREQFIESESLLNAADRALYGIKRVRGVPALSERFITLALASYSEGEASASRTAEILEQPMSAILDYLQLLREPLRSAQKRLSRMKEPIGQGDSHVAESGQAIFQSTASKHD